ncbi:MAG: DUF134 domain-containing protein [Sedimentisphaeraceae bacterium JB056]
MVRPRKHRCIEALPESFVYKPAGVPARDIDWVHITIDEFETIRLLDHMGMDQAQAAENMGVSRPTVTRIYASARKKIADALTMGMAIQIENANITPAVEKSRGRGMGFKRKNRMGGCNTQKQTGDVEE